MVTFWIWGVRNPCLACAALATAAGLTAVADWSLALSTVLVFGVMADIATHLARRAAARSDARRAEILAMHRRDTALEPGRKQAA